MEDSNNCYARMSSPAIELAEASMSMADVDIQTAAKAHQTLNSRHFWNSLSYSLAGASSTYSNIQAW